VAGGENSAALFLRPGGRWVWWFTPAIPALRRAEAGLQVPGLGYIVKACLKKVK
jgi:hypothetical protein